MAARPQLRIVKRSMVEQAADRLRDAILTGALSPGTRLVETALADEIGVSRGTLRSALAELARDRLVECAPYSAWSVVKLDRRRLWEIYSLRATLESGAARLVAAGVSEADRAAVRAAQARLADAETKGDASARLSADLAFHATLVTLCGNQLLIEGYSAIADQLRWVYAVSERRSPERIDLVAWHAPLAEAVCAGEAAEAGRLAYELCMRSLDADLREMTNRETGEPLA